MSARPDGVSSLFHDALPEAPSRPLVEIGAARVTRFDDEAIRVEGPRRVVVGIALAAAGVVVVGAAHATSTDPSTLLFSRGLTLAAIPLVVLAFRALFSRPVFLATRDTILVDAWPSLLARFRMSPARDVRQIRVRLVFERHKDIMRIVSARIVVVLADGRELAGPSSRDFPDAEWRAARDAVAPLAAELARRLRCPVVVDHEGPLPPALRDAVNGRRRDDDAAGDDDDEDDDPRHAKDDAPATT